MMHPDTEIRFINEKIGYGVVATKLIPTGTITWVQDDLDQIFTPAEVEKMHSKSQEMLEKYSFRNNKGNFVLCWDLAKYVNHSFKSNCLSTAYDFEIAVRDIHPGEELTDDYGYLNISEPFEAEDEGASRKTVFPDDLPHFYEIWDEKIAHAFQFFQDVEQPIQNLLSDEVQRKLQKVLLKQQPLDSILNLYYRKS